MQTSDGRLVVIAGKSRSGKTAWTRKAVKNSKRVCAWDPEDQWAQLPGWRRVTTRRQLVAALTSRGSFKVAYVVGANLVEEFNYWAEAVYFAGRFVAPLDVIGEELADVTTPSKAPGNWGILLRRGLKRGINIFALSQRWAEADKTALNNVSQFLLCSMAPQDVEYMARKTGLSADEIAALKKVETATHITCPYILFHYDSGEIERGKLTFKKSG